MDGALRNWQEATRARRREHRLGEVFHPGIVREDAIDPRRVARAAAAALVQHVAQRPLSVSFEPGASFADLANGRVNLDPRVLESAQAFGTALEHLLGLAVHEGAHGRYTRAPSAAVGRLFHWIHNVVEDERVEALAARRHPLLAHPLACTRRDLLAVDRDSDGMLWALFVLLRAPERMPRRLWRRHESFLRAVLGILSPFPWTPRAVRQAVWRIIELLPGEVREAELPVLGCGFGADHDAEGELLAGSDARRRWRDQPGHVERYPRAEWRDAPRDPAGYERVRRETQRDARLFAEGLRSLLPMRRVPRARSGSLDRRRLHAHPYDDRLFRSPGERDLRLALALVIDLSGSMRGESARIAQRIAVAAAEGAALLQGVRLYVYGHTADSGHGASTDIVRFATPARGRVESLGSLPVRHNNRDAHALELIGRDLLRREGPRRVPRLGMLICDGLPEARGFRGRAAVEATRRSLSWFEQVWGPPVLVLTRDAPTLRQLMPGPYFAYDEQNPVPTLIRAMAWKLHRRGAR